MPTVKANIQQITKIAINTRNTERKYCSLSNRKKQEEYSQPTTKTTKQPARRTIQDTRLQSPQTLKQPNANQPIKATYAAITNKSITRAYSDSISMSDIIITTNKMFERIEN